MKIAIQKVIAISLALLFLSVPKLLSAGERRGANLVITLKDGQRVKGELIAAKPDSLLLLDNAGKDESVDLTGIKSITIVRRSKAGSYALYGFVLGAAAGAVLGARNYEYKGTSAFILGLGLGLAAGGAGFVLGASTGGEKTVQLEGKSESDRAMALADLRDKARIRDYK